MTEYVPARIVASPSVAPMVLSLTGCDFKLAGSAPARKILTRRSTSSFWKLPSITPLVVITALMRAADSILPSRTTARLRRNAVSDVPSGLLIEVSSPKSSPPF